MSRGARRSTYLILDPYDAYAVELVRRAFLSHGLRAVCLYTDPALREYLGPLFPELKPELIQEEITCAPDELGRVAEELGGRYDVLGVVPYLEFHLEHFPALERSLGERSWNDPLRVLRCRNKGALMSALAQAGVAVPEAVVVRRAADLPRALRDRWGRFVLKPNDGHSNRHVGFFDRYTEDAVIERHLAGAPGAFLAEEHVDGEPAGSDWEGACLEYSVNGQVDASGRAHVLAVLAVERVPVNGREGVYRREWSIPTTDPRFQELSGYARSVMDALGLQRVPFHLEVRRTAQGPRLIDLGARLPGNGVATLVNRLHGGSVDVFDMALRGWLGLPELPLAPDWKQHDARTALRVYGISRGTEVVLTLRDPAVVESWPSFVEWVKKPWIGQRVVPTLDLDTIPWGADFLVQGSVTDALAVAARAEEHVRWNEAPRSLMDRANGHASRFASRARPRLRTLAGMAAAHLPAWMRS